MKTKAEEALGAIRDVERREDSIAAHIEKLNARIAQQDATIARMREALSDALQGDLRAARAALNQEQVK